MAPISNSGANGMKWGRENTVSPWKPEKSTMPMHSATI